MDFQQNLITTIHDYTLALQDPVQLQQGLRDKPTTILIPCLMEEFRRPALRLIRSVLQELEGLHQLVIALSAGSVEEVREAEQFFADMPFPVHVQWTNAPAVKELLSGFMTRGWISWGHGQGVGRLARAGCRDP